MTGISMFTWTSVKELQNAKNGGSTLLASKSKSKDMDIQISVPIDACDILDSEIRVNTTLIQTSFEDLGKKMGEAVGAELQKVFKALES